MSNFMNTLTGFHSSEPLRCVRVQVSEGDRPDVVVVICHKSTMKVSNLQCLPPYTSLQNKSITKYSINPKYVNLEVHLNKQENKGYVYVCVKVLFYLLLYINQHKDTI